MNKIYQVGIVGAGVSGVVTALQLAENNITSVLFEKKSTVVNGPPFCHLHAGGNLYPDISDEQCRILMKQSIEMAKLFPQSIDERPTFISIPKTEKYEVSQITSRLDMLVAYYSELIAEDNTNQVLGDPDHYYKVYTKEELDLLCSQEVVSVPTTPDQWMINAIKLIDYSKLKTPIILVQEFGWNLFRLGAQAQIALEQLDECDLHLNTSVEKVVDCRSTTNDYNWEIHTNGNIYKTKYLVNASGFMTGAIDESLEINTERLIEFKAAYVSKWQPIEGLIPEFIFHGERGTPHGMAQLTPYCDDYYQIHGMTEDITLFKEGLVKSDIGKAQPEFNGHITQKLTKGWTTAHTIERTEKAIDFIANFVPTFSTAVVGGPPLFGAQQIPGDDPTLRVGEVSFPTNGYARSEIVKASSALTVANQIMDKMIEEGILSPFDIERKDNTSLASIDTLSIDKLAVKFAKVRNYPEAMAYLIVKK